MKTRALLFVVAFTVVLASSICGGLVIVMFWKWFVMPTLGLAELSLAAAMGMYILVTFLTTGYRKLNLDKIRFEKSAIDGLIGEVIALPAVALLFGWIVHFFM